VPLHFSICGSCEHSLDDIKFLKPFYHKLSVFIGIIWKYAALLFAFCFNFGVTSRLRTRMKSSYCILIASIFRTQLSNASHPALFNSKTKCAGVRISIFSTNALKYLLYRVVHLIRQKHTFPQKHRISLHQLAWLNNHPSLLQYISPYHPLKRKRL